MDCVHVGDRNGVKGVYDINLIDEVTQFEHVGAVAGIAETFLVPVLEEMLVTLPFVVVGFHADNGSEYINRQVAAMLNKLHVPDFTKSRARRSNETPSSRARTPAWCAGGSATTTSRSASPRRSTPSRGTCFRRT